MIKKQDIKSVIKAMRKQCREEIVPGNPDWFGAGLKKKIIS